MRRTIKHVCSLAVILLLAIPVKAQVLLRVSDNEAMVDDTVEVSVYADSSLTGLNASSFTMRLTYSDYYVEPIEVTIDSTIIDTAGWEAASNLSDPGLISFTAAGANALSGSGRLATVKFRLLRGGGTYVSFSQSETYFNQAPEDIPLSYQNGYLRVNARPTFSFSFYPSTLVIGDTSQVNVYGGGATAPISWAVSDTSLATIDTLGVLRTKAYGTVDVIAEDSRGIRDTASVDILGFRLTSSDTTNYSGQEVEVHIQTTDLTSLDITSGSFFLSTSVDGRLEVLDIEPGDIMDAGASINYTVQNNGIQIAFAQAPFIVGSGELLTLRLKMKEDQVFSNYTSFSNPIMNENYTGTGVPFYIRAEALPSLTINYNSQSRYLVGDSLQFTVTGNTGPVMWSVTDTALANIDTTGFMVSKKGGTFKVIAEDSIGAKGQTSDFNFYDIVIDLPNESMLLGDTIMYPVPLSNLERSHSSVFGIDFTFTYDPSKLEYLGFSKSGSLTDGWSIVDNQVEPNTIKIVGGAALPFTQSGDMIYLKFAATPAVTNDLYTYLYVTDGLFNEGSPNFFIDNGRIFITTTPLVPVLVSPVNGVIDVSEPVVLDWENAVGAEFYEVEVATSASFDAGSMVLDTTGVTGSTLTLTGLTPLQRYYWRVKAHNATAESAFSSYWNFRMQDVVNLAPIVASAIPDITLMEDFGTVEYAKLDTVFSDPEGAPLSYSLLNSLSFVMADFAADTLMLYARTDSSGTGMLVIQATDDIGQTVTDTVTITVTSVLDAPDLVFPDYEAENVPVDVTLDWEDVDDATSFEVQVATNHTFGPSELFIDTTEVLGSSLDISGLTNSTVYYWRVRSISATDTSEYSTSWVFSTVTGENLPPVIETPIPDVELNEDFGVHTVAFLQSAYSDPEGQPLAFSVLSSPSFIGAEIVNDSLIVSSVQDSSGVGELIFQASDTEGGSITDTVLVTVKPVNDSPFVVELPDTITVILGETLVFEYDSAFADVEDELIDLFYDISISSVDITLDISTTVHYALELSTSTFIGTATLTFIVTDSEGAELTATIVVVVIDVTSSELVEDTPLTFSLEQNYPNPFNPSSNIRFAVPEASQVRLEVYNMLGQRVSTLVNGKLQAGWHTVEFDASGLSTGTYIYRIQAGDFVSTKKMMLVK